MRIRAAVLFVSSMLALAVGVSSSRAQTRIAGERPQCAQVSSSARFDGVAYSHWVSVNNTCERPVSCDVSTNVAPASVHLDVPRRERREINTFLSSPSREFTPTVSCTLAGPGSRASD